MKKKILKIGIVGCGAIGTQIALACRTRMSKTVNLVAVCDVDAAKAQKLKGSLRQKTAIVTLDKLIDRADLVVEAASASISAEVLRRCARAGRDCLIMSVGGLLGRDELLKIAESRGVRVYIPSGALAGIDALKSAAAGRIDSVTLTTRKPPKGLEGAPYITKKRIDLSKIKGERLIFSGNAQEAVKAFPQNVNVSAILSLAGVGARRTRVKIMTSAAYARNSHEVEIRGDFGVIRATTENVPSVSNPKTSALAIYSAIATLENISRNVRIGT